MRGEGREGGREEIRKEGGKGQNINSGLYLHQVDGKLSDVCLCRHLR